MDDLVFNLVHILTLDGMRASYRRPLASLLQKDSALALHSLYRPSTAVFNSIVLSTVPVPDATTSGADSLSSVVGWALSFESWEVKASRLSSRTAPR